MNIYASVISESNEFNVDTVGICGALFFLDNDPLGTGKKVLRVQTKNTMTDLASTTNIAANKISDSTDVCVFETDYYFERISWIYCRHVLTVDLRNKANSHIFSISLEAEDFCENAPALNLRMRLENGQTVPNVLLRCDRWYTLRLEYYQSHDTIADSRLKVFVREDGGEFTLCADIPVRGKDGTIARAAIIHPAKKIRSTQYFDNISVTLADEKYTPSDKPAHLPEALVKRYNFKQGIPSDKNFNIDMLLKKSDMKRKSEWRISYDPAARFKEAKSSPFGHSHDFCEIMLVLTGEGTLVTPNNEIPLFPGVISIVAAGTTHSIVTESGYNILSVAGNFERLSFIDGVCTLQDNIYSEGRKLAELILYNRFGSEDYVTSLCDAYIKYILLNLELAVKNTTASIYKILGQMEKNFGNSDLSIGKLLDESGYTKDYIRNEFLAVTKMTPKKYLTHIRMTNAKALIDLYGEDLSISEVAERCGIIDPSVFSRIFKKHFGISPSEYREGKLK